MSRWLLLACCSLLFLGAVSHLGAARSPEARALGGSCVSDRDCQHGLSCTFEAGVMNGQCASACSSTDSCQDRFGTHSMCLGADLCARTCSSQADCPAETACNGYGWCEG